MSKTRRPRSTWPLWPLLAPALLFPACGRADGQAATPPAPRPADGAPRQSVAALGRVQPLGGIRRLAGPSIYYEVVVGDLRVDEGDRIAAGQIVAVLDHHRVLEAALARSEASVAAKTAAVAARTAEADIARREHARREALHKDGLVTASERDLTASRLEVAESALRQAGLELKADQEDLRRAGLECERAVVRSPMAGLVLKIYARRGEKVGNDGILEMADTDVMSVVAEVYEADIPRVRLGQRAVVRSPLLPHELSGRVDRIGNKIGKKDVLGTDPAARTDVRVIEVRIRLDDAAPVRALTNLSVEVEILPS